MSDFSALVRRFADQTIVVVGDVMIDHFVIGSVERISPEAPVPVVRFAREDHRLGGAANVAANLRALGAAVEIVAIIGEDDEGQRLADSLSAQGIGTSGLVVDRERCTTRKMRVVTDRNQQVARIDYEDDAEASGQIASGLSEAAARLTVKAGAVLISDYLKGTISRPVATSVIDAAHAMRIPVTIDPKVPHVDYYTGATLITPNHHEAQAITHLRMRTDADVHPCAARIREIAGCENVLITRGEHGMWLHTPSGDTGLPAEAREVADVTGAGDTVIAVMTLAMAAGATLEDAARLANRAAGIVVGKFGPASVSAAELG